MMFATYSHSSSTQSSPALSAPVPSTARVHLYTIDLIRDEALQLVQAKRLDRHQPIYTLCKFFPIREWQRIELELEANDYLLRDPILDLLGREDWAED